MKKRGGSPCFRGTSVPPWETTAYYLQHRHRMGLVTVSCAEHVISCAIKVHRSLGPGLFESVYDRCLGHEMTRAGLRFQAEPIVPLTYEGLVISRAFRLDFIVEEELALEIKSVGALQPVHLQQLRTYVRLTGLTKGLLINLNVPLLRNGIRSVVNHADWQPEKR